VIARGLLRGSDPTLLLRVVDAAAEALAALSLESLDDAVAVEGGQGDVDDPQGDENQTAHDLPGTGTAQLGLDRGRPAAHHQHKDGEECKYGEDGDGKRQGFRP